MRVDYQIGFNEFKSEWVCPEHVGWAQKKFEKWWTDRSHDPVPDNTDLAVRIARAGGLAAPTSIIVRKIGGERFERIIKYQLDEKPHSVSENFDFNMENNNNDDSFFDDDDVPF
jgi:DNA repair protein RadD